MKSSAAWRSSVVLAGAVALLAACAPVEPGAERADAAATRLDAATRTLLVTPDTSVAWRTFPLPGKRFSPFQPVRLAGEPALEVKADASVSILQQRFAMPLSSAQQLSFRWRTDALPQDADLALAERSDSPVGVLLAFDGDRKGWSARDHRMSELTRLLTGEELPHATLAYVWSHDAALETVVANPRTARIRKIVLDSGTAQLGQWRLHVRDVAADYRRAFGEEPGPLRAVALMTDTDNTSSRLTAWYGTLHLAPMDARRR